MTVVDPVMITCGVILFVLEIAQGKTAHKE